MNKIFLGCGSHYKCGVNHGDNNHNDNTNVINNIKKSHLRDILSFLQKILKEEIVKGNIKRSQQERTYLHTFKVEGNDPPDWNPQYCSIEKIDYHYYCLEVA